LDQDYEKGKKLLQMWCLRSRKKCRR